MKGLDYSLPLSLYIHVPFCVRKCDYCAFYSLPLAAVEKEWMEKYLSIILAEIDALNRDYGKTYETIFIGGGNPGVLGEKRLRQILEKAQENGRAKEVTVETNPETITPDFMALSDVLTRISVGIQSMDENVLRHLGRNATREDNLKALSILSSSSLRWNADIITAVPGETIETTLHDIEEVASYNPGHISFYCLSFEEGTPLIEREVPIGEDAEAEFLRKGWKKLYDLGYEHYEVSNFAKNGERCRHNEIYWHLGQYVGFGPGSESSIGYFPVTSMRDSETLDAFLRSPELSCTPLTADETEEEFLLTVLRTKDGIDKAEYSRRFRKVFDSVYKDAIRSLDSSFYIDTQNCFSLTEAGFMMLDRIILALAMGI